MMTDGIHDTALPTARDWWWSEEARTEKNQGSSVGGKGLDIARSHV